MSRILVAAFGDPGHAFPAIALAKEFLARGNDVCVETWDKWQPQVEREGLRFAAAPVYTVFGDGKTPLKPYQAAVKASSVTGALIEEFDPEVVVADILTVAAALAAEVHGRRWVTLIPHVLPTPSPGFPPYSIGARLPRTALGRWMWQRWDPLLRGGLEEGREQLNESRGRVGLPPLGHVHGGISRELAIVATFPQLEYPRAWDEQPSVRVTGPLMWEQPFGPVEPPPGDEPLVLVAPSTAQDPAHRMLRAALEGLAGEPVRVLATTNRRDPPMPLPVPPNARLVDWLSYAQTMPLCDAVILHAGHGTLVRAGVSLPRRLTTPEGVRLAVRKLLSDERYGRRARELRDWARAHDGAAAAAAEVEALCAKRLARDAGDG